MTDAGLEHLQGFTELQVLYLGDINVTDAGLERLKGLSNLKELLLGDTKVTDDCVKSLQQALPKCNIVRERLRPGTKPQ